MAPSGPSAIVAGGRSLWPLPYPRPGERGRPAAHARSAKAAPGALDRDLRGDHRDLAGPRSLSRDRRAPHLRGRGRHQRVHRRVPAPQPRALARGGLGPQRCVRARFQRAAREGAARASLARGLDPLLARVARARRADRPPHALRTADHAHLRAGRPRRSRDHPLPHPLSCRRPHGRLGRRGRHSQLVRGVHRPGADARPLERGHHRLAPVCRAPVRERRSAALCLCRRGPGGNRHPDGHTGLVAPRTRRADPGRSRPSRSGSQARADADAARGPRGRAHQLQPRREHVLRVEVRRPPACAERDRRRLQDLHASAGHVLRRRGDGSLPAPLAARRPARHRRLPQHRLARPPADRLPAPARERDRRRPRGADRAAALPTRGVHSRADARRRGGARGLRGRAYVQRHDAHAQPLLLQPAGAVGPDLGRAREPRAERRAR